MKAELVEEPKSIYVVQGFSCPKEIAHVAKQVARKQRRTFSAYIVTLIERDLLTTAPGGKRRSRV